MKKIVILCSLLAYNLVGSSQIDSCFTNNNWYPWIIVETYENERQRVFLVDTLHNRREITPLKRKSYYIIDCASSHYRQAFFYSLTNATTYTWEYFTEDGKGRLTKERKEYLNNGPQ